MDSVEQELKCPHCQYDLRGLPCCTCPECGRQFDPQSAIAGRDERSAFSVVVNGGCVLLGVFIMVLLSTASPWLGTLHFYFGCHGSGPDVAVLELAEILTIVYVPLTWMSSFGGRQRGVLLIPPACMVVNAVPMLFELHGSTLETAQMHFIVGLVPFVPAVVRSRRQVMLVITGVLMLGPAIIGLRMTLDALFGLNAGHHWSAWPDLRVGQVFDQYPLTNDEALLAGTGLMLASLPLAAVWVWLFRQQLRCVWNDTRVKFDAVRRRIQ